MARPNTDARDSGNSYQPPVKNRLTLQEVHALDGELKKYFYKKEVYVPKKEEVELLNKEQWFKDKGAKNKYGAVMVQNYKSPLYAQNGRCIRPVDCEPILYEQLQEDLDQWGKWCSKVAYAKGKELEELKAQLTAHIVLEKGEEEIPF
jgi:hypothetical protein